MKKENRIETRNREKKKNWFRRLLSFFMISLLILIAVFSVSFMGAMMLAHKELQTLPSVDSQYLKTYPTSEITDKDGTVIWKPTEYRVDIIEYEEIPEMYKDFIVSVEDKEFWISEGVSPKGIANMVYGTIRSKVDSSYTARGGSTIDQQLIKNKYFDRGQGHSVVTRKIQEIFLALQLNENFSKEEILTFYVNDLEFAENSKGIKTVLKTYFNKTPKDYEERTVENIAELAYVAGLSQAPSAYNLYVNPEDAHKRTATVLNIILLDGIITQEEYDEALNYDLTTNLQERYWESKLQQKENLNYKTYTDGVKKELSELGYDIDNLSLKIKTHLDIELYNEIQDIVRKDTYYLDDKQQIAVTVLNSENVVVGMVGSRHDGDELNRATQTTRSTGSSTKPMLAYAPLLQYFGDKYNTGSMFDTSNYQYPGSKSVMHNYGRYVYGNQTMHTSLALSHNTPVARIMDGVLGSNRVKTFLSGLNLDSKDKYSSVDGLGIHASTLQVASAYNAFNNAGQFSSPRFINKIVFTNGEEKVVKPEIKQAMNPSVAWVTNHMLRSVISTKGTAPQAAISEFAGYAGKTGTVGFDKSVKAPTPYGIGASDLWYNSITNEGYSISIWTGYDKPNESPQLPSYYKKHQILGKNLQKKLNSSPPPLWEQPNTVQKIKGEGLESYYRITDANENSISLSDWTNLENYKDLTVDDAVKNDVFEESWRETETSLWFDYYNNNGELNPNVIDEEVYQRMRE